MFVVLLTCVGCVFIKQNHTRASSKYLQTCVRVCCLPTRALTGLKSMAHIRTHTHINSHNLALIMVFFSPLSEWLNLCVSKVKMQMYVVRFLRQFHMAASRLCVYFCVVFIALLHFNWALLSMIIIIIFRWSVCCWRVVGTHREFCLNWIWNWQKIQLCSRNQIHLNRIYFARGEQKKKKNKPNCVFTNNKMKLPYNKRILAVCIRKTCKYVSVGCANHIVLYCTHVAVIISMWNGMELVW